MIRLDMDGFSDVTNDLLFQENISYKLWFEGIHLRISS